MSRTFTDDNLISWEAYASGGKFGLPERAKIVFVCLSDPHLRSRYVVGPGDEAEAAGAVHNYSDDELRSMLRVAAELD